MAENSEQDCECRCPCAPQVEETAAPGALMPTTVTAIAAAPQDATVVRLQGVRVLTGSVRSAPTLVAARPGLPEENGLENPEDLEDPADLFLRALAPGDRGALGLSGGGMLWRPAPGGEQGAGPGRFERTDAGVFGSAEGSPARAARGGDEDEGRAAGPAGQYQGIRRSEEQDKRLRTAAQIAESERGAIAKKAALSPGGKAAVAAAKAGKARLGAATAPTRRAAEGVRKKSASALARAGISEDLPGGPGAAAPGALADKGPFTGEIDVGAQKGSEAYAQAGRAAAQRLRRSGRSELADRKRLEERKKRIERVTSGAARPAAPTAATIAARSEGEGAGTGADAGVDRSIDRAAAARSPSTLLPTATLRARSQGDAPPASPGGNAPRALPAARAARATIVATTTPLGSAASIPSPAALRAGARGAAIDLGAFAGPGDVVRVGGGGVRAVAPPEPQPEPAPGEADFAVSTFGEDPFEAGLGAAAGMPRPKRGASPRDSAAAAAAAFAGAVKGAVNFFKRYGGGDWIDDLPLVGGAGSTADMFIQSDVVDGLIGKWRGAIGALRAWIDSQSPFQVVDARGNVVAQGARDPDKYARARKALITSLTTSIRQALIAVWKRNGKKGPKPTSDEARKIAEDLVHEAEAPPQEDGARSGAIGGEFGRGSDPCAEERRTCRESCGCDCVCAPAPGDDGDDDPHPARDPSVRGLRLDTEPVTFAGPPRPFDAGWAMQVAEPDDDSTWGGGRWHDARTDGSMTWGSALAGGGPARTPEDLWAGVGGGAAVGPVAPRRNDEPIDSPNLGAHPLSTDLPGVDDAPSGEELRLGDLRSDQDWPHVGDHSDELPPWYELTELEQHFLLLLLTLWIYERPESIADDAHKYFEFVAVPGSRNLDNGVVTIGDGLKAGLFRYRGARGPTVLSFQGTAGFFRDWKDNIQQATGSVPTQYRDAVDVAVALDQYGPIDFVVGHSLGGGLAQYTALALGIDAVTLNPAPLHESTIRESARLREDLRRTYRWMRPLGGAVINYSVEGDPVSDRLPRVPLPSLGSAWGGAPRRTNRLVGKTRRIPRAYEGTAPTRPTRPEFPNLLKGVVVPPAAPPGTFGPKAILSPPRRYFQNQGRFWVGVLTSTVVTLRNARTAMTRYRADSAAYRLKQMKYTYELTDYVGTNVLDAHSRIEGIHEFIRAVRSGIGYRWGAGGRPQR